MFILELFATAVGVSMDAFSVSICKGLGMKKLNFVQAAIIALIFGGFQAIMPLIGFLIVFLFKDSEPFQNVIINNAYLVAFILLVILGTKMLRDVIKNKRQQEIDKLTDSSKDNKDKLSIPELIALGVATSIDALMVGFAFSVMDVNIVISVIVIGCTTFVFSFVGAFIGHFFGSRWEKPATVVGGIILILIGLRFGAQYFNIL